MILSVAFVISREKIVYNENNYYGALIDKNKLLAETPPPRIIFVGASNLAFGLDSKMIEQEFKMPVINMGLHGDFGLDFILNNVRYYLGKGDIVILSIEYYLDKIDYKTLSYAMHLYPEGEKFINYNPDYYMQMLKYEVSQAQHSRKKITNFLFDKILRLKEAKVFTTNEINSYDTLIYSRKAFNSNGDVVSHLEQAPLKEIRGRNFLKIEDYSKCINSLNEFLEAAAEKGASVYFTYPAYPKNEYEKNIKAVKEFENQLNEGLKIKIISTPEDFVYPDSLFFDTVYHLTKEGRKQRTERTIELMKAQIFKSSANLF